MGTFMSAYGQFFMSADTRSPADTVNRLGVAH
jgi:hypothetical protein